MTVFRLKLSCSTTGIVSCAQWMLWGWPLAGFQAQAELLLHVLSA
jgi:hypothetical protein